MINSSVADTPGELETRSFWLLVDFLRPAFTGVQVTCLSREGRPTRKYRSAKTSSSSANSSSSSTSTSSHGSCGRGRKWSLVGASLLAHLSAAR
jgi:hypothetical protein